MVSRKTMGAMASKKASASSPVSALIAALSAGVVNGPVAIITEAQSEGGRPVNFVVLYLDARMSRELRGNRGGEFVTVYRESASCGELVPVGRLHDERAGATHLLVQKADCIAFPVIGAERIRADKFAQLPFCGPRSDARGASRGE